VSVQCTNLVFGLPDIKSSQQLSDMNMFTPALLCGKQMK